MTRKRKFTDEAMIALLDAGLSHYAAARELGVTKQAVRERVQLLKPRTPPKRRPDPVAEANPSAFDANAGSLAATGGRYSELSAWAQRNGTTYTQAMQRWHMLRMPVSKPVAA